MMLIITAISLVAMVVSGAFAWRVWYAERQRSNARVAALSVAIDGHGAEGLGLFAPESREQPPGRQWIKAGIGAAVAAGLLAAAAMAMRDGPAMSAVAASAQPSLHLVSMHHTRDADNLKVTGLVRNASTGESVAHVTAVVFAFASDGAFVGSGRTPLDRTLEPGGESPFAVSIPGATDVARYRVTFRTDSGVIRHLDARK